MDLVEGDDSLIVTTSRSFPTDWFVRCCMREIPVPWSASFAVAELGL